MELNRHESTRSCDLCRVAGQLAFHFMVTLVLLLPMVRVAAADSAPSFKLRVSYVGDTSGSADSNRIPSFTELEFRGLTRLVIENGGAMQGFVIGDTLAERPYLSLGPRPLPPRCSKIQSSCVKAFRDFRGNDAAWAHARERDSQAFSNRMKGLLAGPRSTTSNVTETVTAALGFLNAPAVGGVNKVLILTTDGIQAPRMRGGAPTIPDDVTTIWINPQKVNRSWIPNALIFTVPAEAMGYLADLLSATHTSSQPAISTKPEDLR